MQHCEFTCNGLKTLPCSGHSSFQVLPTLVQRLLRPPLLQLDCAVYDFRVLFSSPLEILGMLLQWLLQVMFGLHFCSPVLQVHFCAL